MARFRWPWSSRERFSSSWSVGDPAFAAWLRNTEDMDGETVTPYTVLGLSAVLRSVSVISGTIAGLPLRTYERQGDDRSRIPSVFDDPYPGVDGMTRFAWAETVLIHLLLWRNAYLWHEARDTRTGDVTVYRPIHPDSIVKVERVAGRKQFTYRDENGESKVVGSEWITHIPGPSLDGTVGHPLLSSARAIFSGAISGDKAAQTTLRRGIRLAGILTPADDQETVDSTEAAQIIEEMRQRVVGREHSGDIVLINKRMKLEPWTPNNVESQWHETRQAVLGEVGRLFGMPAHLLNDTEKQTSWGTGVAEQNLGLARYTLMHWSTRLEQGLSKRLPDDQFCEFDYKGLLQGTPAEEVRLVMDQVQAGLISLDYACKVLNLPAPDAAQRRVVAPPAPAPTAPPSGFSADHESVLLSLARRDQPAPVVHVGGPTIHVPEQPAPIANVTVQPSPPAQVTFSEDAIKVVEHKPMRTVIDRDPETGAVTGSHEEPIDGA